MYRSSSQISRSAAVAALAGSLALGAALAGCSSTSSTASSSAASSVAPSASDDEAAMGTEEMRALCEQMVSGAMSVDDATALAETNGYVARVGSIDGELQALTMDLREDRFTFEVNGGTVTSCTYG